MKNILTENEEILWQSRIGTHYRSAVLIGQSLLSIAILVGLYILLTKLDYVSEGKYLLLPLLLIAIIYISFKQLMLYANLYVITNERIIIKRGIIRRKLTSIRLENILDTRTTQSILGRIIRYGSVYFYTANQSHESNDFKESIPEFELINNPFKEQSKISHIHKEYKT